MKPNPTPAQLLNENKYLARRAIIFSALIFTLVLVVGGAIFIFSMRQIIRGQKCGELVRLLEHERIKLEAPVSDKINIVLKMATSPLIQRYFSDPADAELKKLAHEEINGYRKALTNSTVFWVNDRDRRFYSDGEYVRVLDPSDTANYWYNMTLYGNEAFNVNINYNPDLNNTNLWINAPVFDADNERRPVGILGTGIDISQFVSAIYENYGGKADLYLFNSIGEVTGAREIRFVMEKRNILDVLGYDAAAIMAATKHLEPGETKTFRTSLGETAVCAIPAFGWYAAAIMPDSTEDYKTAMTWLFLAMLVTMALILVVFNIFIAGLFKPLRETMTALKSALKVKDEFLAEMSHEIRTPMNAITGMAELALRERMSNAAKENVRTIKQASANLLSVVNDIFNRSKTGRPAVADGGDDCGGNDGRVYNNRLADSGNAGGINSGYNVDSSYGEINAAVDPGEPKLVKLSAPDAKVLVVDDIKTNLEVARGLLSFYGIAIDTCQSGAEAIEAVKAKRYDLVFMDQMMPGIDGIGATKAIRELGRGDGDYRHLCDLPVVALTANAVAGTREMFLENGFNDFLAKPVDIDRLGAVLEKWLPKEKQLAVNGDADVKKDACVNIIIEGVDVNIGITRTGGTAAGYLRTLGVFLEDGRGKISEIKKTQHKNDLRFYMICVHSLKSAAANIGAVKLSRMAGELEAAGNHGDREFINANTDKLIADLESTLLAIGEALSAMKNNRDRNHMDWEALNSVLIQLKIAIDDIDPAAINAAVKELERFEDVSDANIAGKIKTISQKIFNGEYDDTMPLLKLLAELPQ